MIGELNTREIETMLSSHLVGRIGCNANGITYVVPISYAYDGRYIYCRTREGMKVDIMRKNPAVCFEVDELKDISNWKSVIAWGKFEELTDTEERSDALQYLIDRELPIVSSQTMHLSPDWPFPPNDIRSIQGVVFRIDLDHKSGRFENSPATYSYP